jgi:hypothetical protein
MVQALILLGHRDPLTDEKLFGVRCFLIALALQVTKAQL